MVPLFDHMVDTWVERPAGKRKVPKFLSPLCSTHVDEDELLLIHTRLTEVAQLDGDVQEEEEEMDEVCLGDDILADEDESSDELDAN